MGVKVLRKSLSQTSKITSWNPVLQNIDFFFFVIVSLQALLCNNTWDIHTLTDKSAGNAVWAGTITLGDGDIAVPITLELATFVALGLITGAGKQWCGKIAPFPIVWLGAKTHSVFAPVVVSAPANIFWLATFLPVLVHRTGFDLVTIPWSNWKVLCNYLSKGKMQARPPKKEKYSRREQDDQFGKMTDYIR